jgi:hypothetical protein
MQIGDARLDRNPLHAIRNKGNAGQSRTRQSKEHAAMTYEYKCVSGPTIVAVRNAKVRDQAVKAFEDIMNAEAASGWEFVGIDEFHISEPQGLLSRRRVFVPAKILVFRREKAASPLAMALAQQPAKKTPAQAEPDASAKAD